MARIMKCAAVALLFCLGGCATFEPSWDLYTPQRSNPAQFEKDRAYCKTLAKQHYTPFDPWALLLAGGGGAAGQPQDPISAIIGAIAGMANAALSQVGNNPADERSVFKTCMDRLTTADHSAGDLGVLDPR